MRNPGTRTLVCDTFRPSDEITVVFNAFTIRNYAQLLILNNTIHIYEGKGIFFSKTANVLPMCKLSSAWDESFEIYIFLLYYSFNAEVTGIETF